MSSMSPTTKTSLREEWGETGTYISKAAFSDIHTYIHDEQDARSALGKGLGAVQLVFFFFFFFFEEAKCYNFFFTY